MSNRPEAGLRIAVAGAGIRGRLYSKVLRRVAGVEVIGLCDPSSRVADAARSELELPVVASHHELLDKQPDAVIVATPDFAHVEVAVDAASAGCHLMVEKPLAMTAEDATTIADAVSRAGRQCLVAFENRWNPAFAGIKERVESGELGPIISQTAVLNVSRLVPNQMIGWAPRTSPIWFQMSHTLDLAMWLSGQEPVRVSAVGARGRLGRDDMDTWDVVQALVELADGSTVSLESNWVLPESMPSFADFRYHVVGADGAAFVDQLEQTFRVASDTLTFPRTLAVEVGGEPQGFPAWMATQFANDLLAGRELSPGAADGVAVTRALCAIEESLETGAPVEIAHTATHG
jgi:predicted dehydrogenase